MSTRLTKLLRAMALVGATVGLSACVAEPYGYGVPAYRVGYGYGGGYYGGGYRAAPFFAPAAYRPAAPVFAPPRPPVGFFGGGGFAPRPAAPVAHGGFFGGAFAPRGPAPQGGGFFGRPHHHHH